MRLDLQAHLSRSAPVRIAVVGAGGVGGYFGGRLAQGGEDVFFIARGANLDALRSRGLFVESVHGDARLAKVAATSSGKEVGPVDVVLVAVKAWQIEDAAREILPMLGPDTAVIPLQNGIEAPVQLGRLVGAGHVLGGLCRLISALVAPGHVRHLGQAADAALLSFGELDGRRSPRVERILAAFSRAPGIKAVAAPDIRSAMWEKFVLLASLGGVSAATRATTGVIRQLPQTRTLLDAAMAEVAQLAGRVGVSLPPDTIAQAFAIIDALPPDSTPSMHRDIVSGRPSELDALSGAVVRLSGGVGVPVHASLYAVLLPQELKARGAPAR